MLQLPAPTPRRFTKAQIAEMSRGGSVKIRMRQPKPDPITKHLEAFKQQAVPYRAAENALAALKETIDDALSPVIFLSEPEDRRCFLRGDYNFYSEDGIRKAVKKERSRLWREMPELRRIARSSSPLALEYQQRLDSYIRNHRALPALEKRMLRDFRREARRCASVQRAAKLRSCERAFNRESTKFWNAFRRLKVEQIRTMTGALAVIDLSAFIFRTEIMHPGFVPDMIAAAHAFLSTNEAQ